MKILLSLDTDFEELKKKHNSHNERQVSPNKIQNSSPKQDEKPPVEEKL